MTSGAGYIFARVDSCPICQRLGPVNFGGIPVAQHLCDTVLWEALLNTYDYVTAIVELGTWQGGFSLYLDAQARWRGIEFHTFDITDPEREIPGFEKIDIYRHADELGKRFAEMGPIVLFCDGGNKPRELKTFPPYLHKESIIVVHDWGTETLPSDVPDFLEEVYGQFCDEIGSLSRIFRIKE